MTDTVKTTITVLGLGKGERAITEIEIPAQPNLGRLREIVEPHLDGQRLEHVAVLHNGKRCSMFVGETSTIDGRPRNVDGTAIYRHNWLKQHPETDPEELPPICGPAVLFDRNVWF